MTPAPSPAPAPSELRALSRAIRLRAILWGALGGLIGLVSAYLFVLLPDTAAAAGSLELLALGTAAVLPGGALVGLVVAWIEHRLVLRSGRLLLREASPVRVGVLSLLFGLVAWFGLYGGLLFALTGSWRVFVIWLEPMQLLVAASAVLPAAVVAVIAAWHTRRALLRRLGPEGDPPEAPAPA